MYRRLAVPASALLCLAAAACGSSSGAAQAASPAPASPTGAPTASSDVESPDAVETTATTNWTQYHGSAAHRGYAAGVPTVTGLKRAWTAALDGQVQASPLVVGSRVIAATENGTVYGLDRTTGAVSWSTHLATPVAAGSLPCGNISPTVGITSTPVYDAATKRLFAVTFTGDGGSLHHVLVALDPTTGAVLQRLPVDAPGSDPRVENQRGALSLSAPTGRVVVPYGGNAGDCGAYHGYLVSVLAANGSGMTVFRTGTGTEAGMWQPSGAAIDSQGYAYGVSGNGSATGGAYDGSDSVNRVDLTTGKLASFFAPSTWAPENAADQDLGSSGVALANGFAWIQGKTDKGYVLPKDALGGIGGGGVTPVTGACATQFGGPAVHGSVVFAPCTDGIRKITINSNGTATLGWKAASSVSGSPVVGGGRVWSLDRSGTLHSLDENTGVERSAIPVGGTARFATPALSGRYLFVPTNAGITAVTTS